MGRVRPDKLGGTMGSGLSRMKFSLGSGLCEGSPCCLPDGKYASLA